MEELNNVFEKWEVLEDGDEFKVIESGTLERGAGWQSYCEVCAEISSEENAHLIAAAPELLEALQCLFDDYKELADSGDAGNWRVEDKPAGKKALHAIGKALGKE